MRWIFGKMLIGLTCGTLGMLFLVPRVSARNFKGYPYGYSIVDIPVSLAVGTVRTAPFPVAPYWYWIMIQVERRLPFDQLICMMGTTAGPLDWKKCSSEDPLLRADWTVWDGQHIVAHGSSTGIDGAGMDEKRYAFKFIGSFPGGTDQKYVLEVKFTKDGTPLNVANPHLIVVRQGYE